MEHTSSRRRNISLFLMIFAAMVLRVSFLGPEYYCQLDDYIQYYNFSTAEPMRVIMEEGLLASRPLAALFDLYLWARLPLYVSVVILSAMYAASGVVLYRVFRGVFSTGCFFVVFLTLLPLGFEGTYWISASARIIPPYFFMAIGLDLFDRFCRTKRLGQLIGSLLLALASFGFYEQMLVLSLTMYLLMMLVHLLQKRRHSLLGLLIFGCVVVYFAVTGYFASAESMLTGRMEIILPGKGYYMDTFLPALLPQIGAAFFKGGWMTLAKGFVRGIALTFRERIYSVILIVPAVVGLFHVFGKEENTRRAEMPHLAPVVGFLAALAPVTPFFIIANPWFSLRNTVPSFLGAALLLDYLVRLVCRDKAKLLAAAFAGICLVASVSELYDYRETTQNDVQAVQSILDAGERYDLSGDVGILNMNPSRLADQNYRYHDHIVGVTNSDWSLYGALVHYAGKELDFQPYPLATVGDTFWAAWNREYKDISRFEHMFYFDEETGSLQKLSVVSSEHEYLLYFEDGSLCARIWDEGEPYGYVELYQ